MSTRYRLTITILLAALLMGVNAQATGVVVKGSVFGGGNEAKVGTDATVNISSGTIIGDVFGGGNDADVLRNTSVTVSGGIVETNVYGGGKMGSVGATTDTIYHVAENKADGALYNFALSWPIEFTYDSYTDENSETRYKGKTTVTIKDTARIEGDVYGAGKGQHEGEAEGLEDVDADTCSSSKKWEYRYTEALIANVRETEVIIDYSAIPSVNDIATANCIVGSVYGGGEDGHVNEDASVTINGGLIGGSVYGGGKGEGFYKGKLYDKNKILQDSNHISNWIAGKVFGNTTIEMNGGHVVKNIYGGGNLGSVGKGNYSGGIDDYSVTGYGELPPKTDENESELWTEDGPFMASGIATVIINSGTVGTPLGIENSFPTGNVFGSSRGKSSIDVGRLSPRYKFAPDFFLGYVNQTSVTIGSDDSNIEGPTIYGSVYGGGQDGHVRRSTEVTINKGTIGQPYNSISSLTSAQQKEIGNVFGAGSGLGLNSEERYNTSSGSVTCTTTVTVKGGTIHQNVYGGGALASVGPPMLPAIFGLGFYELNNISVPYPRPEGSYSSYTTHKSLSYTQVNIQGGEIGSDTFGGNVYGASRGADNNETAYLYNSAYSTDIWSIVNVSDGEIAGSVFGGGEAGEVLQDADVNITDGIIGVSVYGGGDIADVNRNTSVDIQGGTIAKAVFGGGNAADVDGDAEVIISNGTIATANLSGTGVYGGCNAEGTIAGDASVLLTGGTIGATGSIDGTTGVITYANGNKANVHGGGYGSNTYVKGNVVVQIGNINQDQSTTPAATIWGDVYGGSAEGHVNAYPVAQDADEDGRKYSTDKTTKVNLYAGTINGDAYGGGLGTESHPAYVGGEITVNLNGYNNGISDTTVNDDKKGAIVKRIFGANNLYGSPRRNVNVNVYKTQNANETRITNPTVDPGDPDPTAKVMGRFDVDAVYGGGNLAPYIPLDSSTTSTNVTYVYIEGCDRTSIKQVYGGGNAASVPASHVKVNGSFEINEVFGGGNGYDSYVLDDETYLNPGANVGYKNYTHFVKNNTTNEYEPVDNTSPDYPDASTKSARITNYRYGSGIATTEIYAGKINAVYGGSNSKGNISTAAISIYDDMDDECPVTVEETYGGGKNAPMDGEIQLNLDCVKNMPMIFGGAKNADINSDIVLNITNGSYQKVFGGNNEGGAIYGSITVNIEERGCQPIEIEELYGGGYLAPYSIYGYEKDNNGNYKYYKVDENNQFITDGNGDYVEWISGTDADDVKRKLMPLDTSNVKRNHPHINIISATNIGTIYGGGYKAKMVGDPHINVNMKEGKILYDFIKDNANFATLKKDDDNNQILPVGSIDTIFGGGYMAQVVGDTYIEIGTGQWLDGDSIITVNDAGDTLTYKQNTPGGTWNWYKGNTVQANPTPARSYAHITGSVYGGGNQAEVTGNTHVNIRDNDNVTLPDTSIVLIGENIFGGGKGLLTDVETAKVTANTYITLGQDSVYVKKSIYGGGELAQVDGNTNIAISGGTIGTAGQGGATYGNIYGGGFGATTDKLFGRIKGNTNVRISGGTILHNIYGGGAYGSVGTFSYEGEMPSGLSTANTGTANVTITGGTIGTDGHENGMVFGSSRGDVAKPTGEPAVDPNDKLAWVYDANVIIGTSSETPDLTTPLIKGSIYGSGENGHTYHDTDVKVHSGTIGINSSDNVTIKDLEDPSVTVYEGKAYNYPNRGNVYGGGCGTDMYDSDNDGTKDAYNPLAGIVYGATNITVDGGHIVHNVYGAGALGSVGITDNNGAITSGGTTTIAISNGTVGIEGSEGGNVFGAARGDANAPTGLAQVKTTGVNISNGTVYGSVYGGGELGDVGTYSTSIDGTNIYPKGSGICVVTVTGGEIHRNVFGAGKGEANTFTCQKAMVDSTCVKITNGTVNGNVYGGGEIGRVERNTVVKIGEGAGVGTGGTVTSAPIIRGSVFGAGAGKETHGYSALVRGNSTVTVEGNAKIGHNVYGGGEIATVGKYWVSNFTEDPNNPAPSGFPSGMPYATREGGLCTVNIQGYAQVGPDEGGSTDAGHVFGAGKGVQPNYVAPGTGQSQRMNNSNEWEPFATKTAYLQFLETLALASNTELNIGGNATIMGSVYGGSENGFVQEHTEVIIQSANCVIGKDGTTTYGNVFGGGKGLDDFAEAGRVKGNTNVNISGGTMQGSVYGGGELGDVGTINKEAPGKNYKWTNATGILGEDYTYNNTGVCNVTISGASSTATTIKGNVFGAGKGSDNTYECEKAMAYNTVVNISNGTIEKNVYGGGEIGRVENNTSVTIGVESQAEGAAAPIIIGNVFGAGAGVETHGYSALVRGNSAVAIQGNAKIGKNVYGGGEIATVGRYWVSAYNEDPDNPAPEGFPSGMPYATRSGGVCTVIVQDNAQIGPDATASETAGHVFGAGKGVQPHFDKDNADLSKRSRRMDNTGGWDYFASETTYLQFLETLALATNTYVTVNGNTSITSVKGSVYGGSENGFVQDNTNVTIQNGIIGTTDSYGNIFGGGKGLPGFTEAGRTGGGVTVTVNDGTMHGSVYGGGELGIVKGGVTVNINDGTVDKDVFGGGALAHTNTENWDGSTLSLNASTLVNMTGGTVSGNIYGGGLGQKNGINGATSNIEAIVYGNITVTTSGGTAANLYGANNYNGSPKGSVTVNIDNTATPAPGSTFAIDSVFGGGNLAKYEGSTFVNMNNGYVNYIFGGGNLADVTDSVTVTINGGNVVNDVYGGGALANTNTANWNTSTNTWATGMYDTSKDTTKYKTFVNLNGGIIGNAYGGALGDSLHNNPAFVYGDVYVTVDGAALPIQIDTITISNSSEKEAIITKGRVFGGNNQLGTPKAKVTVLVTKTRNAVEKFKDKPRTGDFDKLHTRYDYYKRGDSCDVAAVFGGGNAADYEPVKNQAPNVIIDGCDSVSIRAVYGGGNAAAVPATNVSVDGAYLIEYVFGGGYGAGSNNHGANVGYKSFPMDTVGINKDAYLYGTGPEIGNAIVKIRGGYVDNVFGGSDTRGDIKGTTSTDISEISNGCDLRIGSLYGGGKKAAVFNDVTTFIYCPSNAVENVYGGAEEADIHGNVTLTIVAGKFTNVFGGNKKAGHIDKQITVNLEETEEGCRPIEIDNLYGGCDEAEYSGTDNGTGYNVIVNAKAFTRIGNLFGGSKGSESAPATLTGNTLVNINQTRGYWADSLINVAHIPADSIGIIGNVYGGGNLAEVKGNTVINICTADSVEFITKPKHLWTTPADSVYNSTTKLYKVPVMGAKITGNVFGGGRLANVTNNTDVNIGARYDSIEVKYLVVSGGTGGVTIGGNVYGGGMGIADNFLCNKAMVGEDGAGAIDKDKDGQPDNPEGGTTVIIGNGSVAGSVYGGGMIGRVEKNTMVMIGFGDGGTNESAPVIEGNVFGAGAGVKTHGYSALVRGNPTVIIEGDAKVKGSVYGGGEIASVARYQVVNGSPVALANNWSGRCIVTVQGHAVIGPDQPMQMTAAGGPDDKGHVFGAGKGYLPDTVYSYTDNANRPRRMIVKIDTIHTADNHNWEYVYDSSNSNIWEYFVSEKAYLDYIETLALSSQTDVTIGQNAFVKGSVYGGSENGIVQYDTKVTIADNCQIGCGEGKTGPYSSNDWESEDPANFTECAHWLYEYPYAPYDLYKDSDHDDKPDAATNGYTFYGNVFGGGSGYYPYRQNHPDSLAALKAKDPGYADGVWHKAAGLVRGNTVVNIKGGHILTNVYGGNEQTDVNGHCTINMSGGTVGVPRTVQQMKNHPVTCYVFGAGKGDPRINFNTWTNVDSVTVNITGGRIFGSVFGGGEDGHVLSDVKLTINEDSATTKIGTTGTSYVDGNVFGGGRGFSGDAQTAGTVGGNIEVNIEAGTMLGSVYGGGRLASVGTLFTAPEDPNYGNFVKDDSIGTYGHITVNISGGTIGNDIELRHKDYEFTITGTTAQREEAKKTTLQAQKDNDTIPNTVFELYDSLKINNNTYTYKYRTAHTTGGNVFGGSMGRLDLLNGDRNPIWPKMAQVKTTDVNISGDAVIKSNVYGGSELGTVRDSTHINIFGGTIKRDVYGGGYGSEDTLYTIFTAKEAVPNSPGTYIPHTYAFKPMQFAGCVGIRTRINITGGYIWKSVYGGGEMASVGIINCLVDSTTSAPGKDIIVVGKSNSQYYIYSDMTKHWDDATTFALSWPYYFNYMPGFDGETYINITGGRIGAKEGSDANSLIEIDEDFGDVYGGGKGIAGDFNDYIFCANVGSTEIYIDYKPGNNNVFDPATGNNTSTGNYITGAVYGGAENGHVMDSTYIILKNGLIGHALYGGGSGKGQFSTKLLKICATKNSQNDADYYTRSIYSITAGKVLGNTRIDMSGGYVVRNVYGGGTLGSVGKGNYAGGKDDYSYYEADTMTYNGYGEALDGNLWDSISTFSQAFLSSGICTVNITGGTVGYIKDSHSTKDGLPYGNVFGGCRGASAPNITETPRYLYAPEAFLGYANETHVTIGTPGQSSDNAGQAGNAPRIYGSVYGGGQDGHVRRDAFVTIYSGVIGSTFIADSLNDDMWLHSGNVYGAGSGIGKYKYDFTYDNDYNDTVTYNHSRTAEEDYSTSAGSVTRYTKVEIQGGIIHRNVYGGGSLASIGAPKFPIERTDGDPVSRNEVIISGGQIGDVESHHNSNHNYGGNVYGASRGQEGLGERYSSSVSTSVQISDTARITGNVYGGGEIGAVKQGVDVNISGGTINHDVYGGGSLASTNTSVTTESGKNIYPTTTVNITGGRMHNIYGGGLGSLDIDEHDSIISDVEAFSGNVIVNLNSHYAEADTVGAIVDSIFGANNLNGTPLGHIKVHVFATQNASKASIEQKYPKRPVMGEKDHENETPQAFLQRLIDSLTVSTTPTVTYIDKVDSQVLANAQSIHNKYVDSIAITNFPQAKKDSLLKIMNDSINAVQQQYARLYDVAVVFGGGNLAPYIPANVDSAEVIIDGCGATSICQVYGGGNAASVPSTYVVVNGTYEIDEVFGGGNGNDPYVLLGNTYENPGANVGYYNYTYFVKDNTTGRFKPVDKDNARTREDRAQYYSYEKGTGVATTQIRGGKVHTVYGGSNEKGNIRTTALSVYDNAIDDCPIEVDETYGGGKNASMDGKIVISLDCVKDMDVMFGGAMNADINNDIILNVTNGTFKKVFGGNNEGGAINGSITINIEEKGCQPIVIDELYGGGYLAPYSIYGYETNTTTGEYNYYLVDEDNKFVRENGHYVLSDSINGKLMPLDSLPVGSQIKPSNDPRINIISATRIGNIYGGGYKAKMVGSPYINVNMQEGKMDIKKKIDRVVEEDTIYKYVDLFDHTYQRADLDTEIVNGDSTFYSTIALGTLGYIFGGGYEADVVGDTHIDIGTGEWLNDSLQREMIGYTSTIDTTTFTYIEATDKWSYIDGEDTLTISDKPTPVRNAAVITGNIFGGGDNADINGNTNINIANGHIYFNVYGGGRMGSVGTITDSIKHDRTINEFGSEIAHEFDISWPYQFTYKDGTGSTNITITGGRIGFSGKDNFKKNDSYSYWEHSSIKKDDQKDGEERLDNGDVYGGGQGIAAKRYTEAHIANVKDTRIIVDYNSTPTKNVAKSFDKDDIQGCITGGLYGGGENGHVYDSTYITINNGIIGHNVYGGGKGKDGYSDVILKWKTLEDQIDNLYFKTVGDQKVMKEMSEIDDYYKDTVTVNSIIAGKVYGNTRIEMNGGWVIRNIYGGGNLASVGIGNYASGTDDYYTNGYGERIYNKLFDAADNDSSRWFLNSGIATVIIKSGTVGTFNGIREEEFLPYGNVFGGCRGIAVPNVPRNLTPRIKYCPENFLGFVNESKVVIGDSTTAPRIYGSVYGGGQDGHLRRWTDVTINSGEIGNAYTLENFATILADNRDKTTNEFKIDSLEYDKMQWLGRGNVYGAGSGIGTYSEQYIGTSDKTGNDTILSREMHSSSSGSVTRSTNVTVNGGKIHRNVYAGGSLATIGPPTIPPVLWDADSAWSCNYLTINGGEIGDTLGYSLGYGGNVYGASRGGERFAYEDSASYITTFATTIYTKLDINGGYINGSVFGGGEAGLVKQNSTVNMNGSTTESAIIFRDLFGGGDQADVKGNTSVNISGGWIKKNVYGGGNMGSIGTLIGTPEIHDSIKGADQGVVKVAGALYAFGLSWPVKLQYKEGTGTTHVIVSGGRIGVTGKDYMMKYTELTRNDTLVSVITGQRDSIVTVITDTLNAFGVRITSQQFKDAREDNGDIYGGSKGTTADRYEEAYLANVNNTVVKIDYPTSVVNPTFDNISNYIKVKKDKITIKEDVQGIHGSVYGGGENGHVLDSTILILNNGIIGHGMYGGGKGKDTYTGQLINYFTRTPYITQVASITSGKVYGNTNVTMNGGYVLRNIYGGGNLASVGKGNYSGGTDDYSLEGYGELPPLTTGGDEGPLWANDDFMNSGICRVTIKGGTVGYFNSSHDNMEAFMKDNLPTGNVFGSCRGQAAPAYNDVSPRHLYFPEFFYGYVNQTIVTIGDSIGDGPRILGSVYGGGQDGHVRRGSVVNINNGTIGLDYNQFASNIGDDGINASQFRNRGNVLGAGSGYGIYSYDTRKPDPTDNTKTIIETGYNNSSGSVTCTTTININDGTIYQNVYGGGALASVGAPNIGPDHALGFPELSTTTELYERPSAYSQYNSHGSSSLNNIIINGGTIGSQNGVDNKYGGNVYGASRGEAAMGARFATSIWTKVEAKNGHIFGNVFGGGESGAVTMDTYVELGGKVVESQSRSGSGAPRRAAPAVQPSAAAPAANVNTGTGSNTNTPANVATEAPDARSIRTNRANQ